MDDYHVSFSAADSVEHGLELRTLPDGVNVRTNAGVREDFHEVAVFRLAVLTDSKFLRGQTMPVDLF